MLHSMQFKFAPVMEHCITIFACKLLANLRIMYVHLMLLSQLKT